MKGYKTVVFALLVASAGFFSSPELTAYVAEKLPWFTSGLGTLVILLRAFTSSPMFKKV